MPITKAEVDAIFADATKQIVDDINWRQDVDHSPAVEFRVDVASDTGYPLQLNGRYNPVAGKLSFTILHRTTGRIYALDLGSDHHNPTCQHMGEKHKHRWEDVYADKVAYVPDDITATPDEVIKAWNEFCAEAKITHKGVMQTVPLIQMDLLI